MLPLAIAEWKDVTTLKNVLTLAVPEGKAGLEEAVTAKVQRASGLLAGFGGGD